MGGHFLHHRRIVNEEGITSAHRTTGWPDHRGNAQRIATRRVTRVGVNIVFLGSTEGAFLERDVPVDKQHVLSVLPMRQGIALAGLFRRGLPRLDVGLERRKVLHLAGRTGNPRVAVGGDCHAWIAGSRQAVQAKGNVVCIAAMPVGLRAQVPGVSQLETAPYARHLRELELARSRVARADEPARLQAHVLHEQIETRADGRLASGAIRGKSECRTTVGCIPADRPVPDRIPSAGTRQNARVVVRVHEHRFADDGQIRVAGGT